jgi:hypothetical protein
MSHFLSLETANEIYVWGRYISLIGAVFAFVGVWKWPFAFAGALCGLVGFSMDLAGSSVRDADSDQVRNYVVPRRLTPGEAQAFSKASLNREHRKIHVAFMGGDEEASQYAGDIVQALRQAGWPPDSVYATTPDGKAWFGGPFDQGLQILDYDPAVASTTPTALLLQNAFREAHIFVNGGGVGLSKNGQEATIVLVGRRPLVPQQTYKRKAIKLPDGSSKLIFEPEPKL